jgi:uncharacterized protein (DUF58 family)
MWFRRIFTASPKTGETGRRQPEARDAVSPAGLSLSAAAQRQLNRLQLNTGRSLPGAGVGTRSSYRRRPAMDFREHRPYTAGDDVRFVDWKASARQEHVFIKQGEQLKHVGVDLLIDCSASMAWGDPPKRGAALELAAALGYLALAQGDRLRIYPLTGAGGAAAPVIGPLSGKGHFPALLKSLRLLRFGGQVDPLRSLAGLSRRGRRGGLVLLISDLLGAQALDEGLQSLRLPEWKVILFHLLHPTEIDPALQGEFELQDIETGQVGRYSIMAKDLDTYRSRLQAWREGLEAACRELRVQYTMIPTHWSLEGETLPYLRKAQVVKAL